MIEISEIDEAASEYVLGTLSPSERTEVDDLRKTWPSLEKAILDWELRLAPLATTVPQKEPSPGLFQKIEARIDAEQNLTASRPPARLIRPSWASLALAACFALLVLGGTYLSVSTPPSEQLALLTTAEKPMFLVHLEPKTARLHVERLTEAAPSDKDYELWVIPAGTSVPQPVGVVAKPDSEMPLDGLDPATLSDGTLAVSLEPKGGSPEAGPTGPVIVTGKFKQTAS